MSSYQPQSHIGIRLSLSGQAQTIAGLNATTGATAALARQIQMTSETTHLATTRQWAHNQALFTMRRLAYAGTLAIGAAGAAVVGFGLKFNSSMEQNMVAFTHFLGSEQAATDYLKRLYDLAALTPFQFEGLTSATKRLIAFGYEGEQAYRTMVAIGDAAAGLGVSQEGIDRMILAFGQMRTNGRILGGELRQLSEVGINARKYLQAAFHLTPDDMANIGSLHIPAAAGIEAILQGLEAEFGGFAEKQAGTFRGMLSTIHDYAQMLFGTITKPLFTNLSENYLPKLVSLTKELSGAFEAGGWHGMIQAMDDAFGAGGNLVLVWDRLSIIGQSLWIIWTKQLWPAILNLARVLSPLLAILWPISWALQAIAGMSGPMGVFFKLWILWIFGARIGLVAFVWTLGKGTIALQMFRNWIQITVYGLRLLTAWSFASTYAQTGMGVRIWTNTGILARFVRFVVTGWKNLRVFTAVTWASTAGQAGWRRALMFSGAMMKAFTLLVWQGVRAMVVFLATNPIGWTILLIAGLTALYFKWDWFHDKVDMIFHWLKDHWPLLIAIMLGPLWVVGYGIFKFVQFIWGKLQWVWERAKDLLGWVRDNIPFASLVLGEGNKATDKMMQGPLGGTGETLTVGPFKRREGVRAATFDSGMANFNQSEKYIQTHTTIQVDRRNIAEAVATHKLYKDAQR